MAVESNENFFSEFEKSTYEEWKNAAIAALKGASFEKSMFTQTPEGIELKPIYNKEDIENIDFLKNEFPGFAPYIRHNKPDGFLGKSWEIAQEINYPLPEDVNKALLTDLNNGQNVIRLVVDRATAQHDDFITDDVSGMNICVSTIEDFEKIFNNIDITKYPIYIDAGLAGFATAMLFFNYCEKNGINTADLKGGIELDAVSELVTDGYLPYQISKYYKQVAEFTKWVNSKAPNFQTIKINTTSFHNAGATAVDELAIAMSYAVLVIDSMIENGLSIDEIAPKMKLQFSIGTNFFMEIAKIKAARLLWAKVIKSYSGNESSQKAFIHTETSFRENSMLDPNVNMLRHTTETFSAICGAADSISVGFYDTMFGLPDDFSRRVSRNTQNVLLHESHLADTVDPVGGSYYIESLTYELAKISWEYFQKIELGGGIMQQLKTGEIQKRIEENFEKRIAALVQRRITILGSNKYPNLYEKPIENVRNYTYDQVDEYVLKFEEFLESRNHGTIDEMLTELDAHSAKANENTFNLAYNCAKNGATSGEIFNSLRDENDIPMTVKPLLIQRSSELFEDLRIQASAYKEEYGNFAKINLICFGAVKEWKGRADFALDFFSVGGFESEINDNINDFESAKAKIIELNPKMICFCSTDDKYAEFVPELASAIKEINPEITIILAGYPKDKIEEYTESGVDYFIHIKANIFETLLELQTSYGVRN